jgi:uncharacterized protein YndB with AHSA1/START domain
MTEHASMRITRVFAAPREVVYDAWTEPEHFAAWWGGSAVTVPAESVSMDVRPGGLWTATMVLPDGNEMNWIGEYVITDRPEQLVLTLSDGHNQREIVTVTLAEVEGGTEMTCIQQGNQAADEYDRMTQGYSSFFDAMQELVEG